ncbi:MAG: WGR domain-containing protein [Chloroflexi bacterium]|nr:WGR domain-containing protein [Chloroflexota bacterium]
MSGKVTDLIALHYQAGGSDKVWAAAVVEEEDASALMVSCWGRRGASLQIGVKATVNLAAAQKLFNSKKKEKLAEGYEEIDCTLYGISTTLSSLHPAVSGAASSMGASTGPEATTPRETPRIVVSHVTVLRDAELTTCLNAAEYGVTEKVNGTRCVVSFDGVNLRAYNRRGVEQPTVPDAARSLVELHEPFMVDGERMEGASAGAYAIFDLLEWGCQSVRDWPYSHRIEKLKDALIGAGLIKRAGATLARNVTAVPGLALLIPATEQEDKQAVMSEVMLASGEGIVVRTLDAPSLQGDTRYERKYKFVAEVDAIVIGIKPGIGTGSVRLGLLRPTDGAIIDVGCVRSGLRDADIAHLGALLAQGKEPVLTVSCLKARTVGISLVEPRTSILHLRDDKSASECTTNQLVELLGQDRAAMIDNARPWSAVLSRAA